MKPNRTRILNLMKGILAILFLVWILLSHPVATLLTMGGVIIFGVLGPKVINLIKNRK